MGIQTDDEIVDISPVVTDPVARAKPAKDTPSAPTFAPRLKDASDAPPGAEVPPADKPVQTEQARKLKELRGFLNHAKFTEADILAMWRESGTIDESLASLEEVNEIAPGVIKASVEPWKTTQAALSAFKAKGNL